LPHPGVDDLLIDRRPVEIDARLAGEVGTGERYGNRRTVADQRLQDRLLRSSLQGVPAGVFGMLWRHLEGGPARILVHTTRGDGSERAPEEVLVLRPGQV